VSQILKVKVLLNMLSDKPGIPELNHQLSLHLVSIRDFQDEMFFTDYPMFVALKKFGKKASLARQIRSENHPQESNERELKLNDSEREEEMI
jgi:hypothetical protein